MKGRDLGKKEKIENESRRLRMKKRRLRMKGED
jgi:hypothetical protein